MIYLILGIMLVVAGGVVTVVFWVPQVCDRAKIKQLAGSKYPLVYVIYIANGPLLLLLGIISIIKYYAST
ncbi:MAG: hypothetical protein KKB30_05250 [Proteobacteria bacterium]|nr:hypothetical protein [Pseudomonadota bacterium]MBU1714624.1 hypothetical protein [Pseudomonadota bacterium]